MSDDESWDEPEVNPGLMFVKDAISKSDFVVDTGANFCMVPYRRFKGTLGKWRYPIVAANGTPIFTHGQAKLSVDLQTGRVFSWSFVAADIQNAVIGIDFLTQFDLVVDPRRRKLVDRVTQRGITLTSQPVPLSRLTTHVIYV